MAKKDKMIDETLRFNAEPLVVEEPKLEVKVEEVSTVEEVPVADPPKEVVPNMNPVLHVSC